MDRAAFLRDGCWGAGRFMDEELLSYCWLKYTTPAPRFCELVSNFSQQMAENDKRKSEKTISELNELKNITSKTKELKTKINSNLVRCLFLILLILYL